MKTRMVVVLLGICSLCYGLLSISAKAAPQNSKGLFDVYGCPLQVQCDLDGEWMNPEGEYHNGEQVSKKYGHDYEGKVHHYVIVRCAAKAAAEQARKDSEEQQATVNNLGRAIGTLGQAIAARHEENRLYKEENDKAVVNVVNCQKDPSLVVDSHGKIMPCKDYIPEIREWCVNHKKMNYCKVLAPVAAPAPQVQPQSQQAPVTIPPVQNVIVSQPQAQPQAVNVTETTAPEVSVAEAARRNKAAKEAVKPKENPQPQQ